MTYINKTVICIIILSSLIISISLSGCSNTTTQTKEPNMQKLKQTSDEKESESDSCLELKKTFPIAKCYHELAVSKEDPKICLKIPEESIISYTICGCLANISKIKNDASICELSDNKNCIELCKADFEGKAEEMIKDKMEDVEKINNEALSSEDESICFKHANCFFSSSCLAQIAEIKRDIKICDMIEDCDMIGSFAKDSCISGVELEKINDITQEGDYTKCLDLTGSFYRFNKEMSRKDRCLQQIAVDKEDREICNMITDTEMKDNCLFIIDI